MCSQSKLICCSKIQISPIRKLNLAGGGQARENMIIGKNRKIIVMTFFFFLVSVCFHFRLSFIFFFSLSLLSLFIMNFYLTSKSSFLGGFHGFHVFFLNSNPMKINPWDLKILCLCIEVDILEVGVFTPMLWHHGAVVTMSLFQRIFPDTFYYPGLDQTDACAQSSGKLELERQSTN